MDLAEFHGQEVEHLRVAYPDSPLELKVVGDCRWVMDGRRVEQLLGNLVSNAIHHDLPNGTVRFAVVGDDTDVRIDVSNSGPAIDGTTLVQLFEPLKRGTHERHPGMGLRLYIVREIAKAQGGLWKRAPTGKIRQPRCWH